MKNITDFDASKLFHDYAEIIFRMLWSFVVVLITKFLNAGSCFKWESWFQQGHVQ